MRRLHHWVLRLSLLGSLVLNVLLVGLCLLLSGDGRAELRERQLANHQAVLEAIVATERVRAVDLKPHLERYRSGEVHYDDLTGWTIDVPGRRPNTTDLHEAEVVFDAEGKLSWVGPYKP